MTRPGAWFLIATAILAVACGKEPTPTEGLAKGPRILTTCYPTTWMTERIVGDTVPVSCPLPAGEDPATWQPARDVLAAYQAASLIVTNGADFEKWVHQASLPVTRVVDTAAGFKKDWITLETVAHRHGTGGEHEHGGTDGHTWMDPIQAKAQAAAIHDAVKARFPDHAATYAQNYRELTRVLDALDTRFRSLSAAALEANVALLCNHPAYNYLARRYGWDLGQFPLEPDHPVTAEDLSHAPPPKTSGGRVMLWESPPLPETARRLEQELQIRSVVFSPCENLASAERQRGQDYLSVMDANLDRLEQALRRE